MKNFNFNSKIFVFIISATLLTVTVLGQSPLTISNVQISFINKGTFTEFTLTSTLDGTIANSWMAVGFNSVQRMVSKL